MRISGPNKDTIPILELEHDISTWEVGDQIVVSSTHFDPGETETFIITECPECTNKQVKIDRPPTNTHWGRLDAQTGVDQRAQAGVDDC